MPNSREAALRHARYFVDVLEAAAEQYQAGGESVLPGSKSFDAEWANIHRGQTWTAANAEQDEATVRLASAYHDAGIACLELRLPLHQRLRWIKQHILPPKPPSPQASGHAAFPPVHLGQCGSGWVRVIPAYLGYPLDFR